MTIEEYVQQVDDKRREVFQELLEVVRNNLPEGFQEIMQYGMITFVVPLESYPKGYLERQDEPLPFISLAAQKNHIALYHMGILANKELLEWFQINYQKQVPTKLNMGKSCIRLTNIKHIPFDLLGELVSKTTMTDWITSYEKSIESRGRK